MAQDPDKKGNPLSEFGIAFSYASEPYNCTLKQRNASGGLAAGMLREELPKKENLGLAQGGDCEYHCL